MTVSDDDAAEYMDIVDEHDEVIGRDTRARIHARHDIHRGVHVFVVNDAGELLLQRRAQTTRDYPGHWDASAGGQVAAGETYEQAAVRELDEELGCPPGPLCLVARYDSFSVRQREKRALFTHACEGPFRLPPQVDEVRFATPAEVERLLEAESFTEGFRRSFALWLPARDASG
jgi:16S rRNA (adenine1518-N6/adenine1519-N6)-dimethyltransferase